MIRNNQKKLINTVAISIILILTSLTFVSQVNASISSSEGDGWADVETAWFAKTRHGGAGGFRASVGIDPATPQGQDGWFAGGWTWISNTTYHFRIEYDETSEVAELYVIGQNNNNSLCTYNVGPSEGRIGINARSAPEAGRSTIIENIAFNGVNVGPDDSVSATSISGESAVRHLLISGADLTTDFILEGDFTFQYGIQTHDECPSMVINFENSDDRLCTIHFVTPFRGLDGDTSGWSTTENMVNLSTNTWSLLDGNASVTGYMRNKESFYLTQRGTRGLGINGNEDDEVDSYGRPEVIEVNFFKPFEVDYIEVRSLFDEWWGIEEGEIELWKDGGIIQTIHLVGEDPIGNGNLGKVGTNINPPRIVDSIVFWVPPDQPYTDESDFAVAKINGSIFLEPPIAEANGPYYGQTIDTVTLESTGSSDPDGSIINYIWKIDGEEVYNDSNSSYTFDLISYDEGNYHVELIVEDDDGLIGNDTTSLVVDWTPPIAEANGPYNAYYDQGFEVTFDGSGSIDLDGEIVSYKWDFGDGSTGNGKSPTHIYEEFLSPIVTVTVTDDNGLKDTDTASISFHGRDEFPPIIQLIHPLGGEILSGVQTVKWYAIDDDLTGENLPIELYYSKNNVNWIKLTNSPLCNNIDIEHGSYQWDTRTFADGSYYLRGVVIGTGGIDQFTSQKFTIDNENAGIIIPDVIIEDMTIDSYEWVKDGDVIVVTASITGHNASTLSSERISADLQSFGGGEIVQPHLFNGFISSWMITNVECTIDEGEITVPISIDGVVCGIGSIIVDNIPPELEINRPKNGLYIRDIRVLLSQKTFLVGGLNIDLHVSDNFDIHHVDFFVDDVHMKTDTSSPYTWFLNIRTFFGHHKGTIRIVDKAGNERVKSFEFTMFNPNGEIW